MVSIQKIINYLIANCELTDQSRFKCASIHIYVNDQTLKCFSTLILKSVSLFFSRFIDIGSGLGKPSLHVAQDVKCRISIGIEEQELRWQESFTFICIR